MLYREKGYVKGSPSVASQPQKWEFISFIDGNWICKSQRVFNVSKINIS